MISHEEEKQFLENKNAEWLDLNEIFKPVLKRVWSIAFLAFVFTCITFLYLSLLRPHFQATATLQIGSTKPSTTLSINEAFRESDVSSVQIETQYELLKSRQFASRVIEELNLLESDEFSNHKFKDSVGFLNRKSNNKKVALETAISLFLQRLAIKPLSKTELVRITYTSTSPERAKKIANEIGETYLQYQNDMHTSSQENTSTWLVEQLSDLKLKLKDSETNLQKFKEAENIVDIQGVSGLVGRELNQITSSLLQTIRQQDDLEVTYQYILKNQNNIPKLIELNRINNNGEFIRLRATEDKIEQRMHELSRRYGPKHPKIIAVQAEVDSIKQKINDKALILSQYIVEEFFSIQEKVKATEKRLKEAKATYLRLSGLTDKFSQLQREVATNKEIYNSYLVRFKEADAMGTYKANLYVRFIDRAVTPKYPIASSKKLALILTFVMTVLILSLILIARDFLKDTLNSKHKQANFRDADIIAVLPEFKEDKHQEGLFGHDVRFNDAINALRSSILFHQARKAPKVFAVTSSIAGEGKSTVASYLARSFGEMEKVLLIEADMRLPTFAEKLNYSVHRPGLSNLLANTHPIEQCLIRDPDNRIDILTSGITPANPLVFLSMKRFKSLLTSFENYYDRIIIETPPVIVVSDAVVISKLVQSVLYVVDEENTKRDQIRQGLKLLRQVKAPIEGIVINQSKLKNPEKYNIKYVKNVSNIIKIPKFNSR